MPQKQSNTETVVAHTPGPWKWFDYPDGRKLLCAEHRAVIHCADAPISILPADQALLAAAPDLLAALRETICGVPCACCAGRRAVIAQAEGRDA